MTDDASTSQDSSMLEAVQGVVDRVSSYQDGAPEGTVRHELLAGLDSAGIRLEDAEVTRLADAIEEQHGAVDAASVLGG
ncbi:hypothetical protein FE634_16245 [Nocardioides dongxiaopingii]|uniref:hypothetical protein n=1 Tax=Nocardioides TaxID=1839 RepID=UPI0010C76516|nr:MULTISPECIES: hypothetical protein [Nocardioides]QCW51578.1 hypothetical protein FE634_16245 [Nocardioides sp. S-1144]